MIDIIIPTCWVPKDFPSFLTYLAKCGPYEGINKVIVINNNVSATPKDLPDNIVMLNQVENIFVNPAWNLGFIHSTAKTICLLNDDITFDTGIFSIINQMDLSSFGLLGVDLNDQKKPLRVGPILAMPRGQGYGCMMFLDRANYKIIPNKYKIYWGDNYLFDNQDRLNYIIKGLPIYGKISETSSRYPFPYGETYP